MTTVVAAHAVGDMRLPSQALRVRLAQCIAAPFIPDVPGIVPTAPALFHRWAAFSIPRM